MKKTIIILILLLISALILTSCAFNTPSETKKDQENLSDSEAQKDKDRDTSNPVFGITLENANKIKSGMKYSEIVEILGSDGKEVGGGAIIYEWHINDTEYKQYLHVWFLGSSFTNGELPSDLVADTVEINEIYTERKK